MFLTIDDIRTPEDSYKMEIPKVPSRQQSGEPLQGPGKQAQHREAGGEEDWSR